MIDQKVAFVLGKIDRSAGTRATSTQVPIEFEIPRTVIRDHLVEKAIFTRVGEKRGSHYILAARRI